MKNNIPLTTIDWSNKFKRQKIKFLFISLLVTFIISLNAYKILHKAKDNATLIPVVIATENISENQIIDNSVLGFRNMRKDQLPEQAIFKKKNILNKSSLINISKNQILVAQFFEKKKNPDSISSKLDQNKRAMSIGTDWLASPLLNVKAGDLVDIIASESHKTRNPDGSVALEAQAKLPVRNVKVLKVIKEGNFSKDNYIVLEVTEEQAKNLMSARALKVLINIIVK